MSKRDHDFMSSRDREVGGREGRNKTRLVH